MGKVIIQNETVKNPITLIGRQAGICYGVDITNDEKNFNRGIDCLTANHGRTLEFPDVYMVLDGYSARVIREWYTHIGGAPTRLQASTRYIKYWKGFDYITPPSISASPEATAEYEAVMNNIVRSAEELHNLGIPQEDIANILPLGMTTKIVCKHNARNLIDMSHVRMCSRAYWEYRCLFSDLCEALRNYSDEWAYIVDNYFKPKCDLVGYCTETKCCGRHPKKI